jgi:hypothetical protein
MYGTNMNLRFYLLKRTVRLRFEGSAHRREVSTLSPRLVYEGVAVSSTSVHDISEDAPVVE